MDGALALALPTKQGQLLKVTYGASEHKVLHWKSYDSSGNIWFESVFDIDTFECLENYASKKSLILQKILQVTRRLASGFLKGREYVLVETYLEFPQFWGLGSSSTLIHNIAQWAGVNPFDLLFKTMGGSGYDVACAKSDGPILYEKSQQGPKAHIVEFDPPFKKQLYFVYLGQKQSSEEGIAHYRKSSQRHKDRLISKLTNITKNILNVTGLVEFEKLIGEHEEVIASSLKLQRVKEKHFSDYWGEVKSLGAWGGDFVLVTSSKSLAETKKYFYKKGFFTFLTYEQMIKQRIKK